MSVILIIVAVGAALIALMVQKRSPRLRSIAQGLFVSYTVIVLLLGGAEVYFRYVYADSRMDFALTGRNWKERYVQYNSYGFRDREWTVDELEAAENVVFVVGDSFTEGWGINDPADRYPDLLAEKLGDDYAVVNLGFSGQATSHQLNSLETFPFQSPDVVIWQYFINDIDVAAKSNGMEWDYEVPPRPAIADESYFASYLYWGLNRDRLFYNIEDGRTEWEYMYAAYDNGYIWDVHRAEINQMIDKIESMGARLIMLMYPNMLDPVGSVGYVDRVAQAVEARGHTDILKLYDEAAAWTVEDRIVSRNDSHASVAFNRYVADALYAQFFADDASTETDAEAEASN